MREIVRQLFKLVGVRGIIMITSISAGVAVAVGVPAFNKLWAYTKNFMHISASRGDRVRYRDSIFYTPMPYVYENCDGLVVHNEKDIDAIAVVWTCKHSEGTGEFKRMDILRAGQLEIL